MKPDRPRRRALLVASIGVATVSYALSGCGKSSPPGNLAQPVPTETPIVGNPGIVVVDSGPPTLPEPTAVDAGSPAIADAGKPADGGTVAKPKPTPTPTLAPKRPPTSGNLMAPE